MKQDVETVSKNLDEDFVHILSNVLKANANSLDKITKQLKKLTLDLIALSNSLNHLIDSETYKDAS